MPPTGDALRSRAHSRTSACAGLSIDGAAEASTAPVCACETGVRRLCSGRLACFEYVCACVGVCMCVTGLVSCNIGCAN